jgi:hypothetical protein
LPGTDVAELLGLTAEELRAELVDGKTLADVAEAQGVELDTVVEALLAPMAEKLAQAVEAGKLTQEEADEKLELMEDKVRQSLEEGMPLWKPAPGRVPKEGWRMQPPRNGDLPRQGES